VIATAFGMMRLVLGMRYWLRPHPVKLLARQRFTQAAAIMAAVVLLGILVAMQALI
jgi:hypothetical protein